MKLGHYLRLARKRELKLPLQNMAHKIGIDPAALHRLEAQTTKTYPKRELLEKISKHYKLDYETLVDLLYKHKKKSDPQDTEESTQDSDPQFKTVGIVPIESLPSLAFNKEDIPDSAQVKWVSIPYIEAYTIGIELGQDIPPFFNKKDIVIIKVPPKIKNQDIVALATENLKSFTLHRYVLQNSISCLIGLTPSDPNIPLTPAIQKRIVGIVHCYQRFMPNF